jgi:CO/xanthine dehydrogenase FAD-binding subunit
MTSLDFAQAASLAEAVALLNSPGRRARPVAGGTDLVVMMRQRGAWFDRLVDVSSVPEMRTITETSDEVRVGAAVTFAQAAGDPILQAEAPLLVEACLSVGSPQVRNAGTLGGNIANAAACADSLPPLVALDATAHIAGREGERVLPVGDIVLAPHHTALLDGEIIVAFTFPKLPPGARSAFIKLGRRNAQAIARLSAAAIGRTDARGCIDHVRLAPGAAVPRVTRMTSVETLLLGEQPSPSLFAAAGQKAAEVMLAITGRRWSTEYKEIALQGMVEEALCRVFY